VDPKSIGGRSWTSTFNTARSVYESLPTISVSYVRPSSSTIRATVAFSITWWLVTMYPSSRMTPEPLPVRVRTLSSRVPTSTVTTDGRTLTATASATSRSPPLATISLVTCWTTVVPGVVVVGAAATTVSVENRPRRARMPTTAAAPSTAEMKATTPVEMCPRVSVSGA
jgi:hypothetical protein